MDNEVDTDYNQILGIDVGASPNMNPPPARISKEDMIRAIEGGENAITIRLAPPKPDGQDQGRLVEFLQKYTQRFVCSKEYSKRKVLHFHVVIFDIPDIEVFRVSLKESFPWCKGTNYYCKPVVDINSILPYVIKDGEYLVYGIDRRVIEAFKDTSYQKFTKSDFAKEIEALRAQSIMFQGNGQGDVIARFLCIKSKYGQIPNWNYALAWSQMVMAARRKKYHDDGDFRYFRDLVRDKFEL